MNSASSAGSFTASFTRFSAHGGFFPYFGLGEPRGLSTGEPLFPGESGLLTGEPGLLAGKLREGTEIESGLKLRGRGGVDGAAIGGGSGGGSGNGRGGGGVGRGGEGVESRLTVDVGDDR